MKIKLFALALAAMLLAGPVSGASLPASFDYSATTRFDAFGFNMNKSFEQISGTVSSTAETTSSRLSNSVFTDVPVPAAAWLFMSGLAGLIGISRRKKPRQNHH